MEVPIFICLCGWGEIRTHGPLTRTSHFKCGALNHSATHPCGAYYHILLKITAFYLHRYAIPFIIYLIMRITQKKGDTAVAQAITIFTKMGFDVLLPITESAPYDIVVDTESGLKRVQIRYTSGKEVDLRRIHSNSSGYVVKKTKPKAYDWLFVANDTTAYLLKECLHDRRSVSLSVLPKIPLNLI